MSSERRKDGAFIVWDGNQGVMVTEASDGRAIIVTGSGNVHPFDTVPAVLGSEALRELIAELQRLVDR